MSTVLIGLSPDGPVAVQVTVAVPPGAIMVGAGPCRVVVQPAGAAAAAAVTPVTGCETSRLVIVAVTVAEVPSTLDVRSMLSGEGAVAALKVLSPGSMPAL